MLPVAIDERRHWLSVHDFDASTNEREPVGRKVNHARREGKLAVEPRLDGMAIRRGDIDRLGREERALMAGNDGL
jgi:hypothetical protein